MHLRIWLALLGVPMGLPFERDALRAVRRYLATLILPCMLLLATSCAVGCLITFVVSLCVSVTREYFFSGIVICSTLILASGVGVMYRAYVNGTILGNQTKRGEKSVLHIALSEYVERISRARNTPIVPVYESSAVNVAELRGHRETWSIVVSSRATQPLDQLPIIGAIAHELGHAVLPLGNFTRHMCIHLLSVIDAVLLLLEAYLLSEAGVYVHGRMRNHKVTVQRRHVFAVFLFRVLWPISSYPIKQANEHAADALSAMILGHTYPIITLLTHVSVVEEGQPPALLSSHPRTRMRLGALMAMERNAQQAR